MLTNDQTMLQPDELHTSVSDLATLYRQHFGLILPPVNYEVLLYKYITYLALPLDTFAAVQALARLIRSEFRYSSTKETRRKAGTAFPELQLIALVVIVVKLLYPFDGTSCHPRLFQEPATQRMNWKSWNKNRQQLGERPGEARLSRGSAIDVQDTDVFTMSQEELDSYMNWYQKTWVREPRNQSVDNVNEEILDMFPLQRLEPSTTQTSLQREQDLVGVAIKSAHLTTSWLEFQPPVTDEEVSDNEIKVKRPGEKYMSYKSEEDLSELAKPFFKSAAETACTSIKTLMLAVLQTETRVKIWKSAMRRAEVTGQDFDLDAEMRAHAGRVDVKMQEEMQDMDIGGDEVRSDRSEGEESEVDTQMML